MSERTGSIGGRFRKVVALAGKSRPGPAAPVEFFLKMGFTVAGQITEQDALVQLLLYSEET